MQNQILFIVVSWTNSLASTEKEKKIMGSAMKSFSKKKSVKTNSYFNAFQKNPFYDHFQSFSTLKL